MVHKELPQDEEEQHSPEFEKLPSPLFILNDVRHGFEIWGESRGIQVSYPKDIENFFWAGMNEDIRHYLESIYPFVLFFDVKGDSARLSAELQQVVGNDTVPLFLDNIVGREHPLFHDIRLDICRTTNVYGHDLGLNPRPGTQSFEYQLQIIKRQLSQRGMRKVILVDDVVGPHTITIKKVMELLRTIDIVVEKVYAISAFSEGEKTLADLGIPLRIMTSLVPKGGDALNLCDLIPGHPFGGLKGEYPIARSEQTRSVSFPYVWPYFARPLYDNGVMTIPEEKKRLFGITFLSFSLHLFLHIQHACGRDIMASDFSAPALSITQHDHPIVEDLTINLIRMASRETYGEQP